MKSARRLISTGKLLLTVAGLICWLLVLSTGLYAQICTPGAQGNNAAYNMTCYNSGPGILGSSAFIDALMFLQPNGPGTDICDTLYKLLTNQAGVTYPPDGAVIDARGITTNLTCAAGSPWLENGLSYAGCPRFAPR
jgi:hypothetical protein